MPRIEEDIEAVRKRFLDGIGHLIPPIDGTASNETSNGEPTPSHLFRYSDVGNAELFAHLHRAHARFCYHTRTWWILTDDGCWREDHGNHIMRLAKTTVGHMYDMLKHETDDQRRTQLAAHALRTEHANRLHAMVDLAKNEEGMAIEPQAFDADPMLFNVDNGVIDLKTGACRPRRPEDFLTKQSPAFFDATATCPEWLKFLARIFQDDPKLIEYVQHVVGYCLTGVTVEQAFFLLWGSGANGKSTLMKVLLKLFGAYGLQVPAETFLGRNQDGRATPDLVRLQGARLASASESNDGACLNEGLIKQMTGSDRIAARRLYQDIIEFEPTHKSFLSTNHKPRIKDNTHAMWRRMRLIPFAVQIPDHEQDPALAQKLFAELPGILNWALAGCLSWQRAGRLQTPEQVAAATKVYREEQDILDDYLHERCVCAPGLSVQFSDLRKDYAEWTEALSERPLSGKGFAAALQERGYLPRKVKNARHYTGLRLRTITDELNEAQFVHAGGTADVDLDV